MHADWSAAGPSSRSSEPSREREGRGARDAARLGLATEATNTASAPAQSASDSLATRQPPARKRDIEVDQFLDDLAADLIDRGGGRRRHCSRRSMSPAQPIRFCWDPPSYSHRQRSTVPTRYQVEEKGRLRRLPNYPTNARGFRAT